MQLRWTLVFAILAFSKATPAQERVSATNTERGRFVFRNDASFFGVGFAAPTTSAGVSSLTLANAQFEPQFALAPSIDVFVARNFSLGGTLGLTFNQVPGFLGTKVNAVTFFFMPRVGYNLPLSNRFSLWPQVGIGIGVVAVGGSGGMSATEAMVPLDVFVPVCFHPVQNFFMGIGPALRFYSLDDKTPGLPSGTIVNVDILRFTLAGSVPVF